MIFDVENTASMIYEHIVSTDYFLNVQNFNSSTYYTARNRNVAWYTSLV